jgi:hypothetical protein
VSNQVSTPSAKKRPDVRKSQGARKKLHTALNLLGPAASTAEKPKQQRGTWWSKTSLNLDDLNVTEAERLDFVDWEYAGCLMIANQPENKTTFSDVRRKHLRIAAA